MPIWRVATVTVEPQLTLSSWQILETDNGTKHFVGKDVRDSSGRVSSAIEMFDACTLKGVTSSGRVYQLSGPAGQSEDAQYVWERWCKWNGVQFYMDVTAATVGDQS